MNSEWFGNLAGIVPNTLDSELLPPQHDAVIAGNYVHDNGNPGAPTLALTYPAFGTGILVTGGNGNLVTNNVVEDSATYGILIMPIFDTNIWVTRDNAVRDNVVLVVGQLRAAKPVLSELVESGKLRIVGAVYSLDTGKVEWLPAKSGS